MDIFQRIVRVKPMVLNVLRTNFEARDDDNILLLNVWKNQSGKELTDYSVFCKMLVNNELSTPSSVVRCRRKLQQDNVELRGLLYDERKNQEHLMKNQMKLEF